MTEYPASIAITPRGALRARIAPPGSKSITNRALVAASLADGESQLEGVLESDDTEAMRGCLAALGVRIEDDGDSWRVQGTAGRLRTPDAPLDARASGTTTRFITALATLADGTVVVDGAARIRQRPIQDLTDALAALGAGVEILGEQGCPPVRIAGGGLPGGSAPIDASVSSQFVTAVLLAAPCAGRDVRLEPLGGRVVSRPYVDLTLQVMQGFGAEAAWTPDGALQVSSRHAYAPCRFPIEPDASAAAYPFAAAAIAGGRVRVEGLPRDSIQADLGLLGLLERMGCRVEREDLAVEIEGPAGPLRGLDVDMNDLPDAVLALAVVALFAEGPTRIRNVANLRVKETDRLAALETELRKLGADARAGADDLSIQPGPLRGAEIDTYDDHRMAMAFALAGLRIPGVVIRDPACVRKTWPDYFAALERLK